MKKTTTIPLLTLITALLGYGITSFGQPDTPTLRWQWTAPTTGSPAVQYQGEVESWPAAGGDTTRFNFVVAETTVTTSYSYGYHQRVRVRGVDDLGRSGVWSDWADPWVDNGPPSKPGIPLAGLELTSN